MFSATRFADLRDFGEHLVCFLSVTVADNYLPDKQQHHGIVRPGAEHAQCIGQGVRKFLFVSELVSDLTGKIL